MVYFRECPRSVINDEDALEFVFKFANEYTEESVRHGYQEGKKTRDEKLSVKTLQELGHSMKAILSMSKEAVNWDEEEE